MADIPLHCSKWQLKENENFRIRLLFNEEEGKRVTLLLEEVVDSLEHEHWVEFKMWDYKTMISLRKMATKYHNDSGTFYVDNDIYNDLKIKHLLNDWSFGQIDPHMKIRHNNNVIDDESMKCVKSMYPWLVTAIINKMNNVLEGYES